MLYAQVCCIQDQRYGFSSKSITELGGGEMKSVPELYESDYDWNDKGRIQVRPVS